MKLMLIPVHDVLCVLMCHPVPQVQTVNSQSQKSFLQYHLYHSFQKKHQDKGKVHPSTGHEGTEREYMYSSTLSFTSVLDGDGWSMPHLGRFTPTQRPSTHCIDGWMGPRACLDGQGKSPTRI